MDNNNAKTESFEIVPVFKPPVSCYQNIKLVLKLFYKLVIFKMVPAHFERCFHFVASETFNYSGIDTGVHEDAHVSCSRVMSWLNSKNESTCRREI